MRSNVALAAGQSSAPLHAPGRQANWSLGFRNGLPPLHLAGCCSLVLLGIDQLSVASGDRGILLPGGSLTLVEVGDLPLAAIVQLYGPTVVDHFVQAPVVAVGVSGCRTSSKPRSVTLSNSDEAWTKPPRLCPTGEVGGRLDVQTTSFGEVRRAELLNRLSRLGQGRPAPVTEPCSPAAPPVAYLPWVTITEVPAMLRPCSATLLLGILLLPRCLARADCHHRRLDKVIDNGRTVQLDDGSQWEVSDFDQSEAARWRQDAT